MDRSGAETYPTARDIIEEYAEASEECIKPLKAFRAELQQINTSS